MYKKIRADDEEVLISSSNEQYQHDMILLQEFNMVQSMGVILFRCNILISSFHTYLYVFDFFNILKDLDLSAVVY